MQPVTVNPLTKVLRNFRRPGLKIKVQISGHPVLLMRPWQNSYEGKGYKKPPKMNNILKQLKFLTNLD